MHDNYWWRWYDSLEIIKIIDSSFEGMAQRKLLDGIKYSWVLKWIGSDFQVALSDNNVPIVWWHQEHYRYL